MAKLFLHIGPHKTGSTYIQAFLFENRDYLLGRGVNYSNIGCAGQYGQHEIVEKAKTLEQAHLDEYLTQFIDGEINFISSENFDRLTLEDIKKLGTSFAKLELSEVRIIYYYRSYIDLLPSWWQEEVKHGSMTSFYEFVLPHVLRPFASKIVNPAVVLDLYAEVFGKSNITIVNYELALQQGNILYPIFDLLGLDLEIAKNEFVNSSLKVEIVEIIRALNTIARSDNQWNAHKIRTLFLRKKGADEIRFEIDDLAAVIRAYLKPFRIAGGFFEKTVDATFRRKYASCFNSNLIDKSLDRQVFVPSDNWMLRRDALTACERIYQHIMTGDVSY